VLSGFMIAPTSVYLYKSLILGTKIMISVWLSTVGWAVIGKE
jgi:hypothetical protein